MDENSLTHYGVLGMKWGRRKSKPSKGSNSKKSSTKKTSNVKQKIQKITSKVDKDKVKAVAKTSAKVVGALAATTIIGYTGAVAVINTTRLNEQLAKEWDYSKQIRSLQKENQGLSDELHSKAFPDRSNIINKNLRLLPTTKNGKSNGVIWAMANLAIDQAKKTGEDPLDIAQNWMIEYNNSNRKLSDIIGIKK